MSLNKFFNVGLNGKIGEKIEDKDISHHIEAILKRLLDMDLLEKVKTLNAIRLRLHNISPFRKEPVDCVVWANAETISANDYNPNTVAPPEMELLRRSVQHDGYTQPVVTWHNEEGIEVIDGFHRMRICREYDDINDRVFGFLPIVKIKDECGDRNDRIAATIRHNRARGKHQVTAMSDIVIELKRRNWSDKKIGKELGMDPDEVLRLTQITGLAEMFDDKEFSEAWDAEDVINEDDNLIDEGEQ